MCTKHVQCWSYFPRNMGSHQSPPTSPLLSWPLKGEIWLLEALRCFHPFPAAGRVLAVSPANRFRQHAAAHHDCFPQHCQRKGCSFGWTVSLREGAAIFVARHPVRQKAQFLLSNRILHANASFTVRVGPYAVGYPRVRETGRACWRCRALFSSGPKGLYHKGLASCPT